jgi:hypothetical protein
VIVYLFIYLFVRLLGVSDLEQSEIEVDDDVVESSSRVKKERKRKRGGEKHRKKVSKTSNKVCVNTKLLLSLNDIIVIR